MYIISSGLSPLMVKVGSKDVTITIITLPPILQPIYNPTHSLLSGAVVRAVLVRVRVRVASLGCLVKVGVVTQGQQACTVQGHPVSSV